MSLGMDTLSARKEFTATLALGRRGELMEPRTNQGRFRLSPASGQARVVKTMGEVVTAGRATENQLVVDDPGASAIHAEFRLVPGGAEFRDLGSTNGLWIGDVRVDAGFLPAGAKVRIGGVAVGLESVSETEEPCSNRRSFGAFLGRGTEIGRLIAKLERLAETKYPVLIQGETGVGKELLASAVHERSGRRGPFLALNCGALPESLVESELFGFEAGAFTGAKNGRKGIFERANGGTVFLDELGELPSSQQSALLRVLDPGLVRRIGEEGEERPVDVRVVAATNRDLQKMVNEGTFRSDLFFRLNVTPVLVPPLRSRSKGNIGMLLKLFVEQVAAELGLEELVFSSRSKKVLEAYDWPGNVRELQHVVRSCALEATEDAGRVVVSDDVVSEVLRGRDVSGVDTSISYEEYIQACHKRYAMAVVVECGGNKLAAAKKMGISRSQLYRILT